MEPGRVGRGDLRRLQGRGRCRSTSTTATSPTSSRYLLDNADAEVAHLRARVRPDRGRDPAGPARSCRPPSSSTTAPARDAAGSRRSTTSGARRRPAHRPLGNQRSADDLYILYTGGTTGMPKGVMWRHEDIFFAALGGGPSARPLDAAGADHRAQPAGGRSPVPPDVGARSCTAPRSGACASPLRRRHGVVLYTERRLRRRRDLGHRRAGALHDASRSSATPWRARSPMRSPTHPRPTTSRRLPRSAPAARSSRRRSRTELNEQLPHVMVMDSFGASETGAERHRRRRGQGPPLHRDHELTTVLDDDLRPVDAGARSGRLARTRAHPARLLQGRGQDGRDFVADPDGERWVDPRRLRHHRGRRHRSRCSAAARSASTRAARRSSPKRSRRR